MGLIWIDGANKGPYKGGQTYLPAPDYWDRKYWSKPHPPVQNLLVVGDYCNLTPHERSALLCLQGLSSRTQPCIWLPCGCDPSQDRALQAMVHSGAIEGYTVVPDWKLLFKEFAQCYQGAVVYDPQIYRGNTLAAAIAEAGDLIATSVGVAHELQIPITIDLRGRFTS